MKNKKKCWESDGLWRCERIFYVMRYVWYYSSDNAYVSGLEDVYKDQLKEDL